MCFFYPHKSKASREVANLTERKNLHTPVYGVKEFVSLSVCYKLWPQLSQDWENRIGWYFLGDIFAKISDLKNFYLSEKWLVGPGLRAKTATFRPNIISKHVLDIYQWIQLDLSYTYVLLLLSRSFSVLYSFLQTKTIYFPPTPTASTVFFSQYFLWIFFIL